MLGAHHEPVTDARTRLLLPAPADIAYLLLLFAAAIVRGWQAINTDGDLGRHLRVGETILQRGLFREDLFSWTMAGRPFVPYEWLSEVLFALAHRAAGIPGAIALTAVLVAGSCYSIALLLRRRGVDPLLAFLVTVMAGLVSAFHWLARPHVFTLSAVAALVWLLESGDRPARRTLLATGGLFCLWANLHGGFLFGLVLLGFYLAGDVIADRVAIRGHALMLLAALAGASINPSGLALFAHVTGYLGQSFLIDATLEYRSPDFHTWIGRAFLIALVGVVAALALSRHRLDWRHLVVMLGTTAFALHSVRNIPLWALTVLPLVALHVDDEWRGIPGRIAARLRGSLTAASKQSRPGLSAVAGTVGIGVLAVIEGRGAGPALLERDFDSRVFPVQAVEHLRGLGRQHRIFNELAWGGYILHAWPAQPVFIDGQTDFYGEALSREYLKLSLAMPGWRAELAGRGVDLVLVPHDSRLADALRDDPGWSVWFQDSTAVAMRRNHSSSGDQPDS